MTVKIMSKFKKSYNERERLQSIIDKTIAFNKTLHWDIDERNIYLATTREELLEVYRLRSIVYSDLGYDHEFPDPIEGLNYDKYDEHSAIVFTKNDKVITGTCRIIFDVSSGLPIDKNFSLDYLRKKGKKMAELSRLVINRENKGLGQEPKLLTKGAYLVMKYNNKSTLISVMIHSHFKLYDKFGGFRIEEELQKYGNLAIPFLITSWEIYEVSNFFKKVFLKQKIL